MNLTDNTIFIPGATSGIGLALAQRLQALGNTVIIGGRRTELLSELAAAYGFGTVEIDLADAEQLQTAAADVIARYPALNVVVAMAGIMEPENWHTGVGFLDIAERTVTTNLLGPIRLIAATLDHLIAQPKATIMTVSSGLAFIPYTATPTYAATKAAIHMLSEGVRLQLADTNVEVLELAPPAVRTALFNQTDAEWAMPLDDFADEVIALLTADGSAPEILVERVKFLRNAEREGRYAETVEAVNGGH